MNFTSFTEEELKKLYAAHKENWQKGEMDAVEARVHEMIDEMGDDEREEYYREGTCHYFEMFKMALREIDELKVKLIIKDAYVKMTTEERASE